MTDAEREREIKKLDGFYILAADSIRGMMGSAGKLSTDHPGIENSLPELRRTVEFLRGEWIDIHDEMKGCK